MTGRGAYWNQKRPSPFSVYYILLMRVVGCAAEAAKAPPRPENQFDPLFMRNTLPQAIGRGNERTRSTEFFPASGRTESLILARRAFVHRKQARHEVFLGEAERALLGVRRSGRAVTMREEDTDVFFAG
jgi:hypothetical protein